MNYSSNYSSNNIIPDIRKVNNPIINELNILKNVLTNISNMTPDEIYMATYIQYIDIGNCDFFGYDNDHKSFNGVQENGFKKFVILLDWYFKDINHRLIYLERKKGIEINNNYYDMELTYNYATIDINGAYVKIPKPEIPSGSNDIVTYAQFVNFGTLQYFGYLNNNEINDWQNFVTSVNAHLIDINTRINALNGEPPTPSGSYYWYVGQTKPDSLDGLSPINEYASSIEYTNTSDTRGYVYILLHNSKSITSVIDKVSSGNATFKIIDATTIPDYNIWRTAALAAGSTCIININ